MECCEYNGSEDKFIGCFIAFVLVFIIILVSPVVFLLVRDCNQTKKIKELEAKVVNLEEVSISNTCDRIRMEKWITEQISTVPTIDEVNYLNSKIRAFESIVPFIDDEYKNLGIKRSGFRANKNPSE